MGWWFNGFLLKGVLVYRYVNDDINECICVFVECMLMMSFLYKILVNGYLKNWFW